MRSVKVKLADGVQRALLTSTAEALRKMAQQLTDVAIAMQGRGLDEMPLPWNKRQDDCFDVVVTAVNNIESISKSTFTAMDRDRPTHAQKVLQRRDIRKKSDAASDVQKKPVGRPRKKV